MNILLANIGNRNIKYNNEFIDKKDKQFFAFTKMLWEDIETEKINIQINILDSVLLNYDINMIYLFVTNQNPNFDQDTYYVGKIIEYMLKNKYKIDLIQKTDDPRNRESAFRFFEDFFNKNKYLKDHNLIVSGSGGIPAMKEALNFYSVINLKNLTILDVDENSGTLFTSNIAQQYLKNFEKEILREMIKKHDYSGAYNFLGFSKIQTPDLVRNMFYLTQRYNCNFDKANEIGSQIDFGQKINGFINIRTKEPTDIDDLISYKQLMILELFDNIDITYKKGEYNMVLGQAFNLQEHLTRFLFEKTFRVNTAKDFDEMEKLGVRVEKFAKMPGRYVEINTLRGKIDSIYRESNINFKEFKEFSDKLKIFKEIRNQSIVAHGFGGARQQDAQMIIDIINDFRIKYFGNEDNIFEKIEQEILKKI